MKMVMFVFGIFVSAWLSAATETTWTGAGDDNLTSTAANWSDEADLTDGSVTANFASSGSEALVAGSLSLYGIGFNAGGAFTLGAADGNAKLALGAGGIATAGTGPYALSVPVEIAADQTWNIGKALNITSSVVQSPSSSYTLTKQGSGELSFSGGRELGGNIDVKAGALTLIGENPAGDADIALNKGSSMTLKGAVVNNRITVDPKGGWDEKMAINIPKGYGDSRINGEVTVRYGNFYTKIEASDDAQNKLVFAGGFRCSGGANADGKEYPDGGYAYFQVDGGGVESISCPVIEFSSPLALANRTFYVVPKNINKLGFAGEFVFSAPGNEIKYLGHHSADSTLLLKNCKVKTTVDGAFDNANMTIRCDYNMEWDLCGTEQSVGFIRSTHIAHRAAVITNSHEKFATLRFNHSTSDWTNKVVFAGNLNVEMSGVKKLAIGSPVPAKGDLAVKGGTMEFFADGSWRNARTVTVAGSGRITAVSGNVFSESAVLSLANGNSFAIAAGEDGAVVTQTVARLVVDGVAKEHGCYSAGEGVLKVLYDREKEIVDGVFEVAAGETFVLDPYVLCGEFDTIVLGEGSTLEIADGSRISGDVAYSLVIGSGAVVKLADGIGLCAKDVSYNGEKLSPGRYMDAAWLEGGAGVYVNYGETSGTQVRWTAAGADTLMSTPENWESQVNLADGSVRAVFASAGTEAKVPGSVYLDGMVFNGDKDFKVSSGAADAEILLGSGGISTVGTNLHKISTPVKIAANQEWNLETRLDTILSSDPLSRYVVRKKGAGSLYVNNGGNFSGSIDVAGGGVAVFGENALGAGGRISLANACGFTVGGAVVDKPITFAGAAAGVWNDTTSYSIWGDHGDSVQNGKLVFGQGNFYVRMYCHQAYKSKMIFAGGFESANGFPYFSLGGGGAGNTGYSTVVFTNRPMVVSKGFSLLISNVNRDGYCAKIIFAVPGNKMLSLGHTTYSMKSCMISTTVDWAFDNPNMVVYCDYDMVWDLHGTKQRIGHLNARHNTNRAPVITNSCEEISTLYINQTENSTPRAVFGGKLSVDFSGDKTTTVDCGMTASGDLIVNGGTLAFTENGSWRNASSIVVNGDAKITVCAPQNFGRKSNLVLADENSLEVAEGVTVRVSSLTVGGAALRPGRYVFGAGTVAVGPFGFGIVVR